MQQFNGYYVFLLDPRAACAAAGDKTMMVGLKGNAGVKGVLCFTAG
jgi:hypothetical protein